MTKHYRLKGINDNHGTCDKCGKTNLKKVMWLVEIDPQTNDELNEAFPVGTTCGGKMLGIKKHKSEAQVYQVLENMAKKQAWEKYAEIVDDRSKVLPVPINFDSFAYVLREDAKKVAKKEMALEIARDRLNKRYPITCLSGGKNHKTALQLIKYC